MLKNLLFKLIFRINLVQAIVHGVVGIVLAFLGCGVWALVASTLVSVLIATVMRAFLVDWWPSLTFSLSSVQFMFRFGWKILVATALGQGMANIRGLVIGKHYTPADLSISSRGQQVPSLVANVLSSTVTSVSFPVLAKYQGDPDRFLQIMRQMIQSSCYIIMPLMLLLALNARLIVFVMLGSQWEGAVPYLRIACFTYALWPLHTVNLQAMTALGRSDMYLKVQIIKELFSLAIIYATYRHGVFVMLLAGALFGPFGVMINSYPNYMLVGYSARRQVQDVGPILLACCGMCAVLLLGYAVIDSPWLFLLYSAVAGGGSYLVFSLLLKISSLSLLLSMGCQTKIGKLDCVNRVLAKIMRRAS